jgi:hypothetical protein
MTFQQLEEEWGNEEIVPVKEVAARLRTILDTAHDLLMDPADVFSRQADKCCCCGKALTEVVSRTRGIGPECIRMFGSFTEFAERPDAVAKYRRKYLQETGFLPGR